MAINIKINGRISKPLFFYKQTLMVYFKRILTTNRNLMGFW